ncbi:MAG TPA: S53 family peptidase [Planctomycetaceae bacterium]|nr:S53 family peptidase [Planctomycetaceae bacterium]
MRDRILRRLKSRRAAASALVVVEQLEELQLLSASAVSNLIATPLFASSLSGATANASSGPATPAVTNATPLGNTPAQIAQAYGFNQVAFSNGVKGNGAGQTIAIVDAYADPNIASDLQKFDAQFGLAAPPSFTQAVEQGATTNSGWALETALDVEWAHAMAPQANIVLVEANNSSLSSLLSAVNYARNLANVSVVSMSWGAGEFASETAYDNYFTTPAGHIGITFVASSGDAGAGTTWPSVSPNVLAVGGTTLTTSASGAYSGEAAWSGSGGGVSTFETEPSYQTSVESTGKRTTPDVAYDANPNTGFAVYDSVAYAGQNGWFEVGGTSAGAPQWAALIAIADQGRAISGLGSLSNAQSTLYTLPASDFHDITSGSNGTAATTGYDLVTGRGTPVVTSIVQALSGGSVATTKTASVTAATSTHSTSSKSSSSAPSTPAPSSPSNPPAKETNPALLSPPDVSTGVATDVVQLASISPSSLSLPQTPSPAEPLLTLSTGATVTQALVDVPPLRAVAPMALGPSSVTDGSVGQSNALPQVLSESWQLAPATTSAPFTIAEPVRMVDVDEIAQAAAFVPGSVEDAVDEAISPAAIDALFMTNGWLTQAATSIDAPAPSSSLGKTALAGAAASLGVAGVVAAIRSRRRRASV